MSEVNFNGGQKADSINITQESGKTVINNYITLQLPQDISIADIATLLQHLVDSNANVQISDESGKSMHIESSEE